MAKKDIKRTMVDGGGCHGCSVQHRRHYWTVCYPS